MKRLIGVGTAILALALCAPICWGQQTVDLKALQAAKVTLEKALEIAGHHGKPISAKFEIDDGKLQLSVYTVKAGKFSEVLVNHQTGTVAKVEPISGGDDLKAAQAQNAAMGQAKTSLEAATKKALKANAGSRAVSVVPSIEAGHAVAAVTLTGSQGTKTVSEILK
jgi:hypothetical protein